MRPCAVTNWNYPVDCSLLLNQTSSSILSIRSSDFHLGPSYLITQSSCSFRPQIRFFFFPANNLISCSLKAAATVCGGCQGDSTYGHSRSHGNQPPSGLILWSEILCLWNQFKRIIKEIAAWHAELSTPNRLQQLLITKWLSKFREIFLRMHSPYLVGLLSKTFDCSTLQFEALFTSMLAFMVAFTQRQPADQKSLPHT